MSVTKCSANVVHVMIVVSVPDIVIISHLTIAKTMTDGATPIST